MGVPGMLDQKIWMQMLWMESEGGNETAQMPEEIA